MIDLGPPPGLWVPPKPAIIRPAEPQLLRPPAWGTFPLPFFSPYRPAAAGGNQVTATLVADEEYLNGADVPFGSAEAGRVIAVFGLSFSGTPTAVTIGGETAEFQVGPDQSFVASALVETGTVGDVVVTGPAAYIIYGAYKLLAPDPAFADYFITASNTSGTLDVPAEGAVVAFTVRSTSDISFTAGVDLDDTYNSAVGIWDGWGSREYAGGASGATVSSNTDFPLLMAMSFGPA